MQTHPHIPDPIPFSEMDAPISRHHGEAASAAHRAPRSSGERRPRKARRVAYVVTVRGVAHILKQRDDDACGCMLWEEHMDRCAGRVA